jgi:putative flippase GtrA
MRKHMANFARYFLVGGAATLVDWSVFAIFAVWLSFDYLVVGGIGFVLAAGVNYLLCIKFVYISGIRFNGRHEVAAVYLVSGIGLIMHEIILLASYEYLALPLMLCKVLATGLVLVWNFGARNFYVFAEPAPASGN